MHLDYAIILGVVFGNIYFSLMKNSIKEPNKNCSFVTNKVTDILAFITGGVIVHYGYNIYDNVVLLILGISIITEHILQISYK